VKEIKFYCYCCGCRIQIDDDEDIRICEECRTCPDFIDGPCKETMELEAK
jgi:hypothetical protein